MKMRKILVAAIMAVTVIGASAADWNFGVTPNTPWSSYINMYNQADAWQFGWGEGLPATASANWAAGPAQPLTLSPNTRLYDENVGDPFWVDQDFFTATLVCEFNYYREVTATVGDTVNFNFSSIADTLPAGYEVRAFIKVLDGGASWATTQYNWVNVVAGESASIDLVVADAGAGWEGLQAGFSIKGAYVASTDPIAATGIQIIPEPATIGLVGIAGLGMFIARRRFTI